MNKSTKASGSRPDLTIVLPTYNESKNISIFIPQLEKAIPKAFPKMSFEILVADDNSPDGTASVARGLNKKYKNVRLLARKQKEGLGAALIDAYNHSNGKLIFSMDADLAFDMEHVINMIKKMDEGYDFVIGARYIKGGEYQQNSIRNIIHRFVSRVANIIIITALRLPVHEFTLNFRIFKREVWEKIDVREKYHVMLMETVYKARRAGFRLGEIPVVFKERKFGESKTNLLKQVPVSLKCLIKWTLER